jgi:hypothetical protein
MGDALYVYAFGTALDVASIGDEPAVDGTTNFQRLDEGALSAIYTPVRAEDFSQDAIDAHAKDLQWLGAIGLSHQRVNETLARGRRSIPLRAFTLFASTDNLREFMRSNAATLAATLQRLQGKSEWTFRIEFDASRWNDALLHRVDELQRISAEMETANAGRAYLLRKKLDDVKKNAARTAEESLLQEVAARLEETLAAPIDIENRGRRNGSFPQINALVGEEASARISGIEQELNARYREEGVKVIVSGPWPPYSFAGESGAGETA